MVHTAGCTIRLVVADDHPVVLAGIAELLAAEADLSLVARCREGPEALEAIRRHQPEVAMLDVRMPGMSGLEVLSAVRDERLPTRVVLLTASITEREVLDAMSIGLGGLIMKDALPEEFARCVREVAAGRRWLPDKLLDTEGGGESARRRALERQLFDRLTEREQEVARHVALGRANKEIAERLNLSDGTVKIHLHNIYRKLGVTNRTSLAAAALNTAGGGSFGAGYEQGQPHKDLRRIIK